MCELNVFVEGRREVMKTGLLHHYNSRLCLLKIIQAVSHNMTQ